MVCISETLGTVDCVSTKCEQQQQKKVNDSSGHA